MPTNVIGAFVDRHQLMIILIAHRNFLKFIKCGLGNNAKPNHSVLLTRPDPEHYQLPSYPPSYQPQVKFTRAGYKSLLTII